MLAVIQDLVSVQVIASCAVKLSCWPDSFILSYQEDGNFYCFLKREGNVDPPGLVVWPISQGGRCYRPEVIAVIHYCGDRAKILPYFLYYNSWGRSFFFHTKRGRLFKEM